MTHANNMWFTAFRNWQAVCQVYSIITLNDSYYIISTTELLKEDRQSFCTF